MTQEQKRIKLVEAGGWKPDKRGFGWLSPHGYYDTPPDYFNDLNAVHEVEKVLTEDQYDEYRHHLVKPAGYLWRGIFSATSAQRAEALGKALNLW
jgi:hypothetical protein